ncbi:MAG: GNAT family N-acetyltransferase [Clostridia bacterium]|nr:GNAT family N-acetyltransferase [Clostridia bacterium]
MLTGEMVKLRAYKREEMPKVVALINDPEVKSLLTPGVPFPYTLEDEYKWYESLTGNSSGTYNFAIETIDDGLYLGGCGINNIDWKNRVAVVGIFIGEKSFWGKGYGTDAMKVLMDFIFMEMNINKIKLNVFGFNPRAKKSYEKCGFKVEGHLKQEIFRDGVYHDESVMAILREEYVRL